MSSMRMRSRALVPAGVVAAVATAISGWAPVAQSAPSIGTSEAGHQARAADASDGTFESCAAYFGFGKEEYGVLDVVEFDVADQNGADGVDHAVPTDTHVVLELTNEEGDVLECAPEEVTEVAWQFAMDDINIQGETPLPSWPGPGHYAYPSLSFEPFIEDFGLVVDVGFKVTTVPDGHTLVSPVAVKPLVAHYVTDDNFIDFVSDPRVLDLIEADAGAPARAAFADALEFCPTSEEDVEVTPDLLAAINALRAYRGFEPVTAEETGCFDLGVFNHDVSLVLGIEATKTYVEPIVLALPTETTTSTSTTTTPSTTTPPAPPAVGAQAVPGSPTYTG